MKPLEGLPAKQGLYDPALEKDSCGVGFIAHKIIHIDVEAPLGQLDLPTIELVESLAPFGAANPRPLFYATGVTLSEPPKTMGKTGRHLSVNFQQHHTRMRAVAFGQAEHWLAELTACTENCATPIDIAFRPVINEFRGFRKVELQLVEWRRSESALVAHA